MGMVGVLLCRFIRLLRLCMLGMFRLSRIRLRLLCFWVRFRVLLRLVVFIILLLGNLLVMILWMVLWNSGWLLVIRILYMVCILLLLLWVVGGGLGYVGGCECVYGSSCGCDSLVGGCFVVCCWGCVVDGW